MKKIALAILALILSLASLASCGANTEIVLGEEETTEASADLYAFVTGDVSIHINDLMESTSADASSVKKKLGEPVQYEESNSCAYQGLDKVYYYDGFTIYSRPDGNNDYVLMIVFTDELTSTPAGVHIGSKAEDVVAAYGGSWDGSDGNLYYESGDTGITVKISSGTVAAIQYCYTKG